MKFFALVPSKLNSVRLKEKNIQLLDGKPLLNHVMNTLESIDLVEKIILQSSSDLILKYLDQTYTKLDFQKRPIELDLDQASPQDWIRFFCENYNCDFVILFHITSPFINSQTVIECINSIKEKEFDSSFAAIKYQNFAWFNESPLNYELGKPIPRTQDLQPVTLEQTGFYIFNRENFLLSNSRIGKKPFIKYLQFPENLDIDDREDLELARFIISSGIYTI